MEETKPRLGRGFFCPLEAKYSPTSGHSATGSHERSDVTPARAPDPAGGYYEKHFRSRRRSTD